MPSREDTDQPPVVLLRPFEADKMTAHLTGNKQDEMFIEPKVNDTSSLNSNSLDRSKHP